jgi:hypothetical protein
MPPPGQCRVWYEGRPPGQQPRPTNCNEAERIASRSNNARVIYGDNRGGYSGTWDPRDDRYGDRGTARQRYPNQRGGVLNQAYDQGYRDGITKGREDVRDNDRYDPARHGWYKSADRGYNRNVGYSKAEYQDAYRAGFREGYDETYRPYGNGRTTDRRGVNIPWPF